MLSIRTFVCLKMMVSILDVCHKEKNRGQLDRDVKYVCGRHLFAMEASLSHTHTHTLCKNHIRLMPAGVLTFRTCFLSKKRTGREEENFFQNIKCLFV